ncbi:MAG: hypothetical protein GEV12_21285 [Micromonosporaceae bacterium]|nr:hypothetical protein [Micromonosporaceae bacterium]
MPAGAVAGSARGGRRWGGRRRGSRRSRRRIAAPPGSGAPGRRPAGPAGPRSRPATGRRTPAPSGWPVPAGVAGGRDPASTAPDGRAGHRMVVGTRRHSR